jgi:hypothetical protein
MLREGTRSDCGSTYSNSPQRDHRSKDVRDGSPLLLFRDTPFYTLGGNVTVGAETQDRRIDVYDWSRTSGRIDGAD